MVNQDVFHLQILKGRTKFCKGINEDNSEFFVVQLPFESWRFNEILSASILIWLLLFRKKGNGYDIINFHIAYPNCTYLHFFKKYIKARMVITEHWSAYHFNFGLKKELPRIKRIFKQNIPVITVSEALCDDIQTFAKADFKNYVVPNVVGDEFYTSKDDKPGSLTMLMVSQWKWPKDPFTILKAFRDFLGRYPNLKLVIVGYGPQWDDMQAMIKELQLSNHVQSLDFMTSDEIAERMRHSGALVHCSYYETFSVVCAEALCCGTPVIATAIGGIIELVNDGNGILVDEHSVEKWSEKLELFLNSPERFKSNEISLDARSKFSRTEVGRQYLRALIDVAA